VPAKPGLSTGCARVLRWVMHGTPPPPSLVADDAQGRDPGGFRQSGDGIPGNVPGIPDFHLPARTLSSRCSITTWGPDYRSTARRPASDEIPPPIEHVIKMKVAARRSEWQRARRRATVLRDAPLGTYLGWNHHGERFPCRPKCATTSAAWCLRQDQGATAGRGWNPPCRSRNANKQLARWLRRAVTAAANNASTRVICWRRTGTPLIAQAAASDVCNKAGMAEVQSGAP